MRKGSYAPRVRARWTKTNFDRTQQQWPVWLQPVIFGLYVYEILGVPIPVSIVDSDFIPGLWRYVPSTGSVRWEGEFDAIAVFGRWALEVKTDYALQIQTRFGIKYTDVALNGGDFLTDWTNYVKSDAVNPTTLVCDFNSGIVVEHPPGFALANCNGAYGLRYHQIELLGIDRNDTRPATWSAPTDPW